MTCGYFAPIFKKLWLMVFMFGMVSSVYAQNDIINNTNDSGPDSFRQAILDENSGTAVQAFFDIGLTGSIQTISPNSTLPTVTHIDETYVSPFNGLIILDGSQVSGGTTILLNVQAAEVSIQGLSFTNLQTGNSVFFVAANDSLNMTDGDVTNSSTGTGGVLLSAGSAFNLHITSNYLSQSTTLGFAGNTTSNPGGGADIFMNTGSTATINLDSGVTYGFYDNDGIGGAGNLVKQGAGVLELPTANVYSGGTLLSAGIIIAGNNLSLGTGAVTVSGGNLTLEGNAVTNTIALTGGTLQVGDLGNQNAVLQNSLTVTGGTLTGTGTVQGTVVNNGLVYAGLNMGTTNTNQGSLNVGNYTQSSAGTLRIDLLNNSAASLQASGTANLNGTLYLGGQGPTGGLVRWVDPILYAAGGVSGTFSNVTNNFSGYNTLLSYGSTSVTLTLSMASPLEISSQASVIPANDLILLNAMTQALPTAGTALVDKIQEIYDIETAQSGPAAQQAAVDKILTNLIGPVYASNTQTTLFSQEVGQQTFLQNLTRRQMENDFSNHQGLWAENDDQFGSTAATAALEVYNQSNVNDMLGYDLPLGGGLSGGLWVGNTAPSQSNSSDGMSSADVKTWQFGLYAVQKGPVELAAEGSLGINQYTITRNVVIGSDMSQAQGQFGGYQTGFSVQAGLPWISGGLTLEPLVGVDWSHLEMNAFSETGADPLDLSVSAQNYDALSPYLGMSGTRDFSLNKTEQLTPFVNLTLSRDLLDQTTGYQAALSGAPDSTFTVTGNTPDPLLWGVGAGVELTLEQIKIYADYNGFFNSSQNLNTFQGGLSTAL